MKLTAETVIAADRETVWRLSQTPALHARWDLRFTDIEYLPRGEADAVQRFRYATRIGFGLEGISIEIAGWGETVGDPARTTSALRFGSTDRKSLIEEGAGSWTYRDVEDGVSFSTVYDYTTRHGAPGRVLDLAFRPLMIWATRWSFDRLRLWIEDGIRPEIALRLWIVKLILRGALALTWIHEGLVPKILVTHASEIALVERSSLYWSTPARSLWWLGAAEIVFGFWLLSGRAERLTSIVSMLAICVLAGFVVALEPSALADPFGGISKNLGLLACGIAVWLLSPYAPMARRARPRRRRRGWASPFVAVLGGDGLRAVAPLVRAHFAPPMGVHRYEGMMTKVWRVDGWRRWATAPWLRLGCAMHTLFPETGTDIPFAIVNRAFRGADGVTRMTFERTFRFPTIVRRFVATMHYDAGEAAILDFLGRHRHLLVELVPAVDAGGITMRSGRQWITPFGLPLRIPLPRVFAGEATIREWQESESSLGIRVTISNRLFGPFFGYEGTFSPIVR